MAKWRYDNVRALLAVTDPMLRSGLRSAFVNQGLRDCREVTSIDELTARLGTEEVDLLVTTFRVGGADTGNMMQQLRHARLGPNPFVIVMTLLEDPNSELAQTAVDAGTDDLLLMPSQPLQLVERLDNFVVGRKPFVITHDYVGPDRRSIDLPGLPVAPRLEVPNPVRWQVVANSTGMSLKDQIREATDRINLHKMKSYGALICIQADAIAARFAETGSQLEILPEVDNLCEIGADLARRMADSNFAGAAELVTSLSILCERVARKGRLPRSEEVGILPGLARAIRRVLDEDPEAVSWSDAALSLSQIFPGLT